MDAVAGRNTSRSDSLEAGKGCIGGCARNIKDNEAAQSERSGFRSLQDRESMMFVFTPKQPGSYPRPTPQ